MREDDKNSIETIKETVETNEDRKILSEEVNNKLESINESETKILKEDSKKTFLNNTNISNNNEIEKNNTNSKKDISFEYNNITKAKVTKIIDGDTIVASINGENYKIRLIGIDTPETKHQKKGVEYYGKESTEYTSKNLLNKDVYLEKDVSDVDKYGRLLRYVWMYNAMGNVDFYNASKKDVERYMFNAKSVKNGYAQASTYQPDVKYQNYFRDFQHFAVNKKTGLWDEKKYNSFIAQSSNNSKSSNKTPKKSNTSIKSSSNIIAKTNKTSINKKSRNQISSFADLSDKKSRSQDISKTKEDKNEKKTNNNSSNFSKYVDSNGNGLIKGNINSKGEKIYHTPNSRSYKRTKIDTSKGERWFKTVEEAENAGWRAPRN